MTGTSASVGIPDTYNFTNFTSNPTMYVIVIAVSVIYFIVFALIGLGKKGGDNGGDNGGGGTGVGKRGGIRIMEIIILAFFLIIIVIAGLQYFFGVEILATIKNMFGDEPEVDLTIKDDSGIKDGTMETDHGEELIPEITKKPQVFHVPGAYDYSNAKALCKAYGGRLASISQMMEAYNKGADWCDYGWSQDRMALYPTQFETWQNFQKIEGHKEDCGRPGVNGGYNNNRTQPLGANCYGFKPKASQTDQDAMNSDQIYPTTLKNKAMHQRVKYWQGQINHMLVSPFNYDTWSEI